VSETKRDLRSIVAALSLLLIGAVLGVMFDRFHHRAPHVIVHRLQPQREASLAMLDSMLELRDDQRERVREIMERRQPAIDTIWRHTHLDLRAALDSTIGDLEAVLDASQLTRLRALSEGLRNPSGLIAPSGTAPSGVFRH
jgi:hypothetical protein